MARGTSKRTKHFAWHPEHNHLSGKTSSFKTPYAKNSSTLSFDRMHRPPPSVVEHQVEDGSIPHNSFSAALAPTPPSDTLPVHQQVFEDGAPAPFPTSTPDPVDNNGPCMPVPGQTTVDDNISQSNDHKIVYNYHVIGNVVNAPNHGMITQNFGDVKDWLKSLFTMLNISRKTDYGYYPGRKEEEGLRRGGCTPGTRLSVIEAILEWARDTSPNCQRIFWLSGQGGAGKTTIAFHITKLLVFDSTGTIQATVLGGSFFCSRHSPETRTASAIVPTIAYHLAVQSSAFREALKHHGDFEKANHDPLSQFEALIVKPWRQCLQQRTLNHEPCLIVSIDAIDELDPPGGTDFLETLIKVVEKHHLPGLKFFVTSRLEPALVDLIEGFDNKQVCRLEKIPVEESNADVQLYLEANLDKSIIKYEKALVKQVVTEAAGLFIYAATVVDYLKGRSAAQQKDRLTKLLGPSSHGSSRPKGVTAKLDHLYRHILETSLVDPRDQDDSCISTQCLIILHTFLCTNERTSTSVAVELLNKAGAEEIAPVDAAEADELVRRLHAVLYIQDGQVLWYHKSFPDFIFDAERSKAFHCRQDEYHRLLVNGCFGVMRQELRFNIGDIPTSYQVDRDNAALANIVKKNISAPLSYACRSWGVHLAATPATSPETISETLGDFLELKVLFWIEAMNLLGCRGHCAAMLVTAQSWAAKLQESSSLQSDLDDAAAFAFYFSSHGAALSTPHLYVSSLATFPRRSGPSLKWKQQFSGIPVFTNSHLTGGGGLVSSTMMEDSVNSVAISRDGTQIAIGLDNGMIRIRGLATGEELKTLRGYTGYVESVAYSPDGKHIVSGSDDMSVRVWDASTGKQLASLEGHTDGVTSVAYSPDGKHIVSGSHDTLLGVWDASTGKQVASLEGHIDRVRSVAYSPNGKHIVSGSHDTSLRVWNTLTGKKLASLEGHMHRVRSVAYSPDGKHIVSGSEDRLVRVWDASTGSQLVFLECHTDNLNSVAYSPDGKHVASGSRDRSVRIRSPLAEHPGIPYLHEKIGEVRTGWLLSPIDPSQYLMFVPLSENLPDAWNILAIPSSFIAHVDLSKARLGDCWTDCYTPDI